MAGEDKSGGLFGTLGAGLSMIPGLGGLGGLLSGGFGQMLGGLGSIFGNQKSMQYYDDAINNIKNLPGMQGPSNLLGDFGTSINGQFGFNPQMGAANQLIGSGLGGLLSGQGSNQFGNIDLQGMLNQFPTMSQEAMNTISGGAAPTLFDMGMANMQAAGNQQGLYDQQLSLLREAYAPQRQVEQNQLFDDLYSKGLIGQNTATQGQNNMLDRFFDRQNQQDLAFQNQAFDRALAQQTFLGNLGSGQVSQGLGAEGQSFNQTLGANQFNLGAATNRFNLAQGLFGLGQNAFAQNYGLGLQGAESLLGYGNFGLNAAAMPYQLQAGLLQGGGYHANALADIGINQASSSSSFMGGLFG